MGLIPLNQKRFDEKFGQYQQEDLPALEPYENLIPIGPAYDPRIVELALQ